MTNSMINPEAVVSLIEVAGEGQLDQQYRLANQMIRAIAHAQLREAIGNDDILERYIWEQVVVTMDIMNQAEERRIAAGMAGVGREVE